MDRLSSPKRYLFLSLALVAILLSACSGTATATNPPEVVSESASVVATESSPPVVEAGSDVESAASNPATQPAVDITPPAASEDPAEAEVSVKPTPRPDLHASDPSTVSLASGQVQLVEFFAFW